MNAYLVQIPETRSEYYAGGYEPPEQWIPTGIFFAETRGQAKADALNEWAGGTKTGVYHDDWSALRTRLLKRDVEHQRGELVHNDPLSDQLWARVHLVLDHAGGECDCPEYRWDSEKMDWVEVAA